MKTRRSSAETQTGAIGPATDGIRSNRSRGSTLHLQRWMTQLPEAEELDPPEPEMEMWSVEELRKRSKELNLLEVADIVGKNVETKDTTPVEKKENDKSPSKSSNSGSQITVRTSPVVVDTIPVCRQCHKKCLSKPNSPLISQKEPPIPPKPKTESSPQNSQSNKSSVSSCSANCSNRKQKHFGNLERKGAIRIRPEDAPKAALKVIDSINQSQRMLKSKSYDLKTDSGITNKSISRSNTKSQLELRKENSILSPSPTSSSRNSPLSTSHTTCSSMVFNSSSNDLRMSNSNIPNQVQCVIAQEKYINEVKCVENITLSKTKKQNYPSPGTLRKEEMTRKKAEFVLNKVLGMNIITRRENVGTCLKTSSVFLDDDSIHEDDSDFKIERGLRRSPRMGISAMTKMNGDISKKSESTEDVNANMTDVLSDEDSELGPLMLMGLSAINPAAHLMRVEPFKRKAGTTFNSVNSRPGSLTSDRTQSDSPVPNIAVVPPTPDYNSGNKTDVLIDESPDSPDAPDDLPYVSLKRYGTMSSLERLPSDETDDGNIRLNPQESETTKTVTTVTSAGLMGWTARAGSFVVEKINIFSHTETVPNTSIALKQPSFLERCLGVSDWKPAIGTEDGTIETGEGSGASGEEAWGTPSSGDLSDNLPDSEHGTLSSPTKSSSSYAGDDDTELMMDELLMAPTITGPTTLRPLLPRDVFRRRLEPLLEEDYSDSGSEDNKPTPTNSDDQGSERGLDADDCCNAPHLPPSASEPEAGVGVCVAQPTEVGEEPGGGDEYELSPDKTPTNEAPSIPLQSASKEFAERAFAGGGRRGSASSASTPSTLERTTIQNPTPMHQLSPASEPPQAPESSHQEVVIPAEERLTPKAEMRLALDQGKDMLAEQEGSWGGAPDPWSFRAACQRSLARRVASADAVTLCRRTAPHTTSRSSVYAWKLPENETKLTEMEQLARAEAQMMRSRTRSLCQNGKIMGFLRRRASSDSPRREPFDLNISRPFSPRRTTEKQFEKRFWKQVNRRRQSCGSLTQI